MSSTSGCDQLAQLEIADGRDGRVYERMYIAFSKKGYYIFNHAMAKKRFGSGK